MRLPSLEYDPQKCCKHVHDLFLRNSTQNATPIFVINQMTEKQMSLIRTLRFTVQVIN